MTQTVTYQTVFSAIQKNSNRNSQTSTQVTSTQAELPIGKARETHNHRWLTDATNIALLSVFFGTVLVCFVGIAGRFIEQVLRYSSFDLLRALSGIL